MLLWLLWRRAGLEHPFPAFMDALATGAPISLLAPRLKPFQSIFLSPKFLAVPLVTLLIPLTQLWSNRFYESVGFTIFEVGVALSMIHVRERRYWILNSAPFVWVGSISYSLYLWQQPFLNRWSSAPWVAFPLNLALAVLFAAASYYLVEEPFLKLRQLRTRKALPFIVQASDPGTQFMLLGMNPLLKSVFGFLRLGKVGRELQGPPVRIQRFRAASSLRQRLAKFEIRLSRWLQFQRSRKIADGFRSVAVFPCQQTQPEPCIRLIRIQPQGVRKALVRLSIFSQRPIGAAKIGVSLGE